MPSVDRVTKAYTVQVANLVRTQFFFFFLKKTFSTVRKKRAVDAARQEFFKSSGSTQKKIRDQFGDVAVKVAMEKSYNKCLDLASKNCSEDPSLELCTFCFEKKADTYLVHGVKAHKSVCAVCAMTLALELSRSGKAAECPFCRETITLIVESAPTVLECVCKQESCGRHLVVSQINDGERRNTMDYMRSFCECHTCTLETTVSRCSMVYSLFT